MFSVAEISAAVKVAPMPLPVKEQILDQIMGHHDDLHRPDPKRRNGRPLIERTAEARKIGAFDFLRLEPGGDEVYAYCKRGVPAYDVLVRDGQAVHCGCEDFRRGEMRQPDYLCKHCDLFNTTSRTLEELTAEACRLAAAFMAAKIRRRYGRSTDEEVRCALVALKEAEARASWFALDATQEGGRAEEVGDGRRAPLALAA